PTKVIPSSSSVTRVDAESVTAGAASDNTSTVHRMSGLRNLPAPYLSARAPSRQRLSAAVAVRRVSPAVVAAAEELIWGVNVISAPPASVTPSRITIGGMRAL